MPYNRYEYVGSYPFYIKTKIGGNYKLYAVHIWQHDTIQDRRRIRVMDMPEQPKMGFKTIEELVIFTEKTFLDKRMFMEWAYEFRSFGDPIDGWQRQELKPYKWGKVGR